MMLRILYILVAFLSCSRVRAAAVFAHFMVGNTENFTVDDCTHNMQLALDAHIDAFALNMASGWYYNLQAVANAFAAAPGNGSWPEAEVISMIHEFGALDAYYKYHGKPFASTFEGPGNAKDWINIKAQTECFFMPDLSSVEAGPAMELAGGATDGLFSWVTWPWGNLNMTTYVDASYNQTLTAAGKPYMMPVSPWFYTNMPGYNKNWLWRGDDLWY
ncbi:uncharacterized protein P174DRAFT_435029 [Aspergillus novofumigatus IBT 16806]|uniref:Uncharacterized protein n=1 Tax=Aspergillus novofumigatus (strain IBT 16806) TaxID=1392255 RepID=A0A2I1BW94_ASPN1|nr:uncharacterized protein P174DRAFT_435029 [Aspergillus novofumigatus IBT 16806]PKX89654.1 hypothetical protein P174DRAFT_435029 [Aspergillus novofumigatus IBT 16806]